MSRAARFREADIIRLISAMRKLGIEVRRIVIAPTGEIQADLQPLEGASDQISGRPNDFDAEFG